MDDQVDPCEDFNKFACGGFEKNTVIPGDKGESTSIQTIDEKSNSQIRKLIEEPISNKDDFESYKKAKKYYKLCMNEEKQNELGFKPLKDILSIVGGWPVLEGDGWKGEDFNIWDQSINLKHMGLSSNYFSSYFAILPDYKNTSQRVLYIYAPSLGLSKVMLSDSYCNCNFLKKNHDYQHRKAFIQQFSIPHRGLTIFNRCICNLFVLNTLF